MLHFYSSHPFVKCGCRVSCAPPLHNLPAVLNLNGIFIAWETIWALHKLSDIIDKILFDRNIVVIIHAINYII